MSVYATWGGFLLAVLAGLVPLFITKDGWPWSRRIKYSLALLLAGGAISISIVRYERNLPSPKSEILAGVVVDEETNQSIGRAEVTIPGRAESDITDDRGGFRIELEGRLPTSNRIKIRVAKNGYETQELPVQLPQDSIEIALRKR